MPEETKWVWFSALGVKSGFIRNVKISLELFLRKVSLHGFVMNVCKTIFLAHNFLTVLK